MKFYKSGLNPVWRVSAFSLEQKIANALQIKNHCFPNQRIQVSWKTIWKLEKLNWIERVPVQRQYQRTTKYFSATNKGLKEFMMINELSELKMQLKSNSPEHDLTLTDIRIQFSKSPRCLLYFSENIILSKLYESEIPEIGKLRSHRCDATAFVEASVGRGALWVPIEYERPGKSIERLKGKLQNYYSNENIQAVLYICQGQALVQKMKNIDAAIYPNIDRKIYFIELTEFLSATDEVIFCNNKNDVIKFKLNEEPKVILPIVDHDLVISIANQYKK